MNAEIIAVGTELLLGQILNTNARYISRKLSEYGINVYYQTVVGDNPKRLSAALGAAADRAELIITTGGLGPTCDDLTKETIAQFCGLKCVTHEESLKRLRERFEKHGLYMAENNLKQAELPEGCIVLKNEKGTAPGAIIGNGKNTFIMLPGPPFEMEAMFDGEVCPYLEKHTDSVIFSKTLRVFGIGESALEEKLQKLMLSSVNPSLAPYAKVGEVELRLTAKADSRDAACGMLVPLEEKVRAVLGDMIYAEGEENSLESTVCRILTEKGKKLALAESCTGGLTAQKITSVPGASDCFDFGAVTYSNAQKQRVLGVAAETLEKHGAVSEETALEMCRGVCECSGADFGIGITGIAGPGGGTAEKPVGLVYIGIYGNGVHRAFRFNFAGDRDTVRQRSSMHALDLVRRAALGLELMPKTDNTKE